MRKNSVENNVTYILVQIATTSKVVANSVDRTS